MVPVVMDQPFHKSIKGNRVISYLVPADEHHRHRGMPVVRHYSSLQHLSVAERRKMKRRKEREAIREETDYRIDRWHLIQVLEVDLARERLVPVEDIGCHCALFVGELACLSLSTHRFPSVARNAVYFGWNGYYSGKIGVRYLAEKSTDPPFQFVQEDVETDVRSPWTLIHERVRRLAPIARPCTLQENRVCCAGIKGGLKD